MSKDIKHNPVIIIGAGPVGMVLALLLHHAGVKVKLVDKRDTPTSLPRAIAINQATLTLFKELGLKEVFKQGLKVPFVQPYWKNKKLKKFDFKNSKTAYPYFFHVQQSIIEEVLVEEIIKLGISYLRSTELVNFKQENNQIMVALKSNGRTTQHKYDFLVGADGGQSKTRELINAEIDIKQYGAYFMLADVTFKNNFQYSFTHYHFSPDGYAMLVPIANKQTRLIFSFQGKVEKYEIQTWNKASVQKLLNQRVNKTFAIENLVWATQANFGHRLSQKVFDGRVVLVGDALHQFSPVGGTNMNVGLQDSVALAEVLISSLETPKNTRCLLDRFAADRMKIMQEQQSMTEWFTALMTRTKRYPSTRRYSLKNAEQQLLGYSVKHLNRNSQFKY